MLIPIFYNGYILWNIVDHYSYQLIDITQINQPILPQ